jgi:hypothetical protein
MISDSLGAQSPTSAELRASIVCCSHFKTVGLGSGLTLAKLNSRYLGVLYRGNPILASGIEELVFLTASSDDVVYKRGADCAMAK